MFNGVPAASPFSLYQVTVLRSLSSVGNITSSPSQYESAASNCGALGSALTVIVLVSDVSDEHNIPPFTTTL